MSNLRDTLRDLVEKLSEENYDESFAQYRLWFDIGDAHRHLCQNQLDMDIERIVRPESLKDLIHPTAHLLIRFIGDAEADQKISRHASGLHRRRSMSALGSFFEVNLSLVRSANYSSWKPYFLTNVNLIARWVNLGHVEEETIRNRILQSLIAHPKLHDHQVDALAVLFKLAGATFGTYADPSTVDRCFELLKGYSSHDLVKMRLIRVSTSSVGEQHWN
jgi:hypothetical protein